jgi:hypothetical protein
MAERRLDLWALFLTTALVGCGSSTDTGVKTGHQGHDAGSNGAAPGSGAMGNDDSGGAGGSGASSGDGAASGNGSLGGTAGTGGPNGGAAGVGGSIGKIPIGTTQCSDGKDNDGDGLIDSRDPECTGPLDNDEGSFATGIPGDNVDPKWQDCFFDGNSGGGDDGCRYSTGCLTGELAPTDKNCQVTAACVKFCKPLVPNGCDCFGCCEVFGPDGGIAHVTIASTCTYADIGNPTKCPVCTPSTACNNTCERCELCVGKTSIPADCGQGTGGAPSGGAGGASSGGAPSGGAGGSVPNGGAGGGYCAAPACAPGQQACGVDCLPDCPQGQYCLTGCCIPSVR